MESNIKFVREYMSCGYKFFDIVYKSNHVYTLPEEDLPKTAKEFIFRAEKIEKQYDIVFKRVETIYS